MKLLIICFILSLNTAFATPVCKETNQWKCELFLKYDQDRNGIIEDRELSEIYQEEFKKSVEKKVKETYRSEMIVKLSSSIFRYHIKYGKLVDQRNFSSITQFLKFLVKMRFEKTEMDFSDLVLAMSSFKLSR